MNDQLFRDIFQLIMSKKNLSQKLFYLFKGFMFYFFLLHISKKAERKGNHASASSHAGDDIYPLF